MDILALPASSRNLQIDFLRGVALLSIYVDHIPHNPVSKFTISALGFFDAAEVFVFLSGLTAARVFGNALDQAPIFGVAQVLHRVWTLYVVHLFLFILFSAQVSWTAAHFQNLMFAEEMQITSFLVEPHAAVLHALALSFQPTFMDILPLYIVLLLGFTIVFPLWRRWPTATLLLSLALWTGVQNQGWSLSTYPNGVWYFNPLAWQALFIIGMSVGRARAALDWLWTPTAQRLSLGLSVLLGLIHLGMAAGEIYDRVPPQIAQIIWPYAGKTDLCFIRLINFLVVAHVVACWTRRLPPPSSRWLTPIVRCGQHSLNVFCLGLLMSFAGHLILVEVDSSILTLTALNVGGIGLLALSAQYLHWYGKQRREIKHSSAGE